MERRFAPYLIAAATVCALTLGACAREAARNGPADANAPAPPSTPSPSSKGDAERVTFTTDDAAGVAIVGDLYIPEKTPAPAILALHQFQANRATYAAFAKTMRDSGFVVLAIDGRGFGDSKNGADGAVPPGWDTQGDIGAAIEYLKSQPSVDAQRIGLIGASYGASNALIFAADNPVDIRSAVLLSVGLNYHGSLPTEPALKKYGDRPLLLMAANDDTEDGPQTPALAATVKNPKYKVQMYDKGGHGTSLLAPEVGGLDVVKAFFIRTLTGPIAEHTGTPDSGGEPAGPAPATEPQNP